MKEFHPIVIIQRIKDKRREKEEMLRIFADRIDCALSKKNVAGLKEITTSLKKHGITASVLKGITETASTNVHAFVRHEIRVIKGNPVLDKKAKTFADISGWSPFMKIVVALRELYADDIDTKFSYEEAFQIIVDHFLFQH